MGGSTGTLSQVKMVPTTVGAERDRAIDSVVGGMPGPHQTTSTKIGTIGKVNSEKPLLIKVFDADGVAIAGGGWVRLLHSPEELVERYGTVTIDGVEIPDITNKRVQVTLTGVTGEDATAIICGDATQPGVSGDVSLACYAIYQG